MKKLMLVLAMGTFGFASVQATSSPLSFGVEQPYQDDKVEIEKEDLPQAVQDAIQNDNEVSDLEISKAYQVTKDNQLFYKIKFEEGPSGEEITRKYDATGQKVEKDDEKHHDELEREPVRL
ncbi:MAG: hypothetical protein WD426_14780 [Anditalea sp.]